VRAIGTFIWTRICQTAAMLLWKHNLRAYFIVHVFSKSVNFAKFRSGSSVRGHWCAIR
jgi:hypothetical protein